jgi:dCTP deaminase
MSVLPDHQIARLADEGVIDPFDPAMLQPSSYDVKLGNTFRRYKDIISSDALLIQQIGELAPPAVIDPEDQVSLDLLTRREEVADRQVVIIAPHECVLGVTKERVKIPTNLVCRLEGKSSLGRLFLAVHITAGYIDPGFQGNITLEMTNLNTRPIIVRPGMPIAQIGFHAMSSAPRKPYNGRYQNNMEATASKYGQRRT